MKIENIDLSAYPNSTKVYVDGKLFPIRVGMRVIHQYPTVKFENGKRVEYPNEDITVYDTSGLYTDPEYTVDINKGLPRHREAWIEQRDDTFVQDDITSEYGRARRDDRKLDSIRFPVSHKPRKAKEGQRVTQMHYARKGIITPEMEYVAIRENLAMERGEDQPSRSRANGDRFRFQREAEHEYRQFGSLFRN